MKTTGAGIVGIGGFGVASGERGTDLDTTRVGTTHFVEAYLSHAGAPGFPSDHSDDPAEYYVDPADGSLTLVPFARDAVIRQFVEEDAVVSENGQEVRSLPAVNFDHGPQTRLSAGPSRDVLLEGEYTSPTASLDVGSGETVEVAVEGADASVDPGTEAELRLSPREVTVRRVGSSTTEVADVHRGGTLAVRELGGVESTTVVPVLTVRNHGRVDVFRSEGGESA